MTIYKFPPLDVNFNSSMKPKANERAFRCKMNDNYFSIRLSLDVAKPNYASKFFVKNFHNPSKNTNLLDLCAGTGFIGIVLGTIFKFSHITLTDINPSAISIAKENIRINGLEKISDVIQGDLFTPLHNRTFDVITCLPPQVPIPREIIEHSKIERNDFFNYNVCGGEDGRRIIDRVIQKAPNYLNKGGSLMLVHPDYLGINETFERSKSVGLTPKIVNQQEFPFGNTLKYCYKYIEEFLEFEFPIDEKGLKFQTLFLLSFVK